MYSARDGLNCPICSEWSYGWFCAARVPLYSSLSGLSLQLCLLQSFCTYGGILLNLVVILARPAPSSKALWCSNAEGNGLQLCLSK